MSEKAFQNYFMSVGKALNYHRTSLINGNGYPDITGFHGAKHSLVELKYVELGKKGNKKIRPLFKSSQPPWYIEYFKNGGNRLFVAFKIVDFGGDNKRYALWQLRKQDILDMDDLMYKDLSHDPGFVYKEYTSCKVMIEEIQYWGAER